jgi:hypothetical protein
LPLTTSREFDSSQSMRSSRCMKEFLCCPMRSLNGNGSSSRCASSLTVLSLMCRRRETSSTE